MKEYQKEYENYMKQLVDNFIMMQAVTCTYNGEEISNFIVILNDGLSWTPIKREEWIREYFPATENETYNRETAKQYLFENTLSYEEYIDKFSSALKITTDSEICNCNSDNDTKFYCTGIHEARAHLLDIENKRKNNK